MTLKGGKGFKDFFPLDSSRGQEILILLRHIQPEQGLFW